MVVTAPCPAQERPPAAARQISSCSGKHKCWVAHLVWRAEHSQKQQRGRVIRGRWTCIQRQIGLAVVASLSPPQACRPCSVRQEGHGTIHECPEQGQCIETLQAVNLSWWITTSLSPIHLLQTCAETDVSLATVWPAPATQWQGQEDECKQQQGCMLGNEPGLVMMKQPHQPATAKPIGDSCASTKGFSMISVPSIISMRPGVCGR